MIIDDHKKNRKTNCRKFYENHIVGDRSENVVTLDETLVYEEDANGQTSTLHEKAYLKIRYSKKLKVLGRHMGLKMAIKHF